jgi:signal transduction histidine kinase
MIREQVERSDRIITAILDFARNRPAQPGPCRISAIISKAREQAALSAAVEFIQIVPEDLPLLYVDETQITQVLHNLITNAAQVMNNRGRITVECTVVPEEVRDPRPAASQRGPHPPMVAVRVADTGPGIAPDSLARIFEPFFTERPQGIGLALTICRSFVENNHGTITVASELGRGTTFTVALPAIANGNPPTAGPPRSNSDR